MYHLKISIPSYRQVSAPINVTKTDASKNHTVYHIEVGFLGEYGVRMDQFDDRPSRGGRGAKFYRIEKRYSSFLALHNEVCVLVLYLMNLLN